MEESVNIPEDFDNLEKHAPKLSRIDKHNPFQVPEAYFNTSADNSIAEVKIKSINLKGDFTLPANYFEQFSELISAHIKLEEISSRLGFTEPTSNYFDAFPEKMLAIAQRSAVKESTKRINTVKIIKFRYQKIAVAASLFILIGLGALFYIQNQPKNRVGETAINSISNLDIKSYLEANVDENTILEYASQKNIVITSVTLDKKELLNYLMEDVDDRNEINEL